MRVLVRVAQASCGVVAGLVVAGALACTSHELAAHSPQTAGAKGAQADNPLLAQLAYEDQASRTGTVIARTDDERRKLVLAELGAGRVVTPADAYGAAIVLQHSPLSFRGDELVADDPDDYLLAHDLAQRAFEGGDARARVLVAQTIDRYLTFTEGYQKYGTNRLINQTTQQEELVWVDRATTDSERAVYGIPPLAELLKRYPERPRKKP